MFDLMSHNAILGHIKKGLDWLINVKTMFKSMIHNYMFDPFRIILNCGQTGIQKMLTQIMETKIWVIQAQSYVWLR